MDKITIMINGIPGNVAVNVARHALGDERFSVIPVSLTGPDITDEEYSVLDTPFRLVKPDQRKERIREIREAYDPFITIDYTHPSAVNGNAEFYCKHLLPFVMGTTGGDRNALVETVNASENRAVIAPNMAKQIVGFQAMMEYAANMFPDLFKGFSLTIKESHQQGKADTSGTAKAMVKYFNRLGLSYSDTDIIKERDPAVQKDSLGIPEAYLGGHAWHTYTLVSGDRTATFEFTHNINGRDIYCEGTLDAVMFLSESIKRGESKKVFSMIDVLKG